jgi:hypothetical protein
VTGRVARVSWFHRDVVWLRGENRVALYPICRACDFRYVDGRWQSGPYVPPARHIPTQAELEASLGEPDPSPRCPRCGVTPLSEVETVCVECLGTQFMDAAADRAARTGLSSEHAYTEFHQVVKMMHDLSVMKDTERALVKGPSAWERVLKDEDD